MSEGILLEIDIFVRKEAYFLYKFPARLLVGARVVTIIITRVCISKCVFFSVRTFIFNDKRHFIWLILRCTLVVKHPTKLGLDNKRHQGL